MKKAFDGLSFEMFKRLAKDTSLSDYEKIGFPDSYREGYDNAIFEDILGKLPRLSENKSSFLDIGPGCSDLPKKIINESLKKNQFVTLIDSTEMLKLLPDNKSIQKINGFFPDCIDQDNFQEKYDSILCYSVLHYIYAEEKIEDFVKTCCFLLNHNGTLLIGDIPNISKRNRFFSSEAGINFHKSFMNTSDLPDIIDSSSGANFIDDDTIKNIIFSFRAKGLDAYVVPQSKFLPMHNRREDIIVYKP